MKVVDLNADLGESFGNFTIGQDAELLALVSSANVACGFHASDPRVMDETVALCARSLVAVGAHPGFPDRVGFGRRVMELSGREAETDVMYQIGALEAFCRAAGVVMQHVKAHGALYNHANVTPELAQGIASGVARLRPDLIFVCQPGTEMERAARQAGLPVAHEGFMDRAYNADGSLVSRRRGDAIIQDAAKAVEQALRMVQDSQVVASDGSLVDLPVHTICVHGDNPSAPQFMRLLRKRLHEAKVEIRPMREILARG